MMKHSLYTNFILTVIALLLAWDVFTRIGSSVVNAQNSATEFGVVSVGEPYAPLSALTEIQKRLNEEGKGQEIIAMVPDSKRYIVVYGRPKP